MLHWWTYNNPSLRRWHLSRNKNDRNNQQCQNPQNSKQQQEQVQRLKGWIMFKGWKCWYVQEAKKVKGAQVKSIEGRVFGWIRLYRRVVRNFDFILWDVFLRGKLYDLTYVWKDQSGCYTENGLYIGSQNWKPREILEL